uniref:NADP-dependent oxidoreductase domain-containing protein n=1 Tax=Odontella aurita TaxID=265563 RepID=A0A7S4JRV3_9STRA|mmetsp:Transcript_5220/g.15079  ORF Transcript_5220/g.15079 Transcript_5220/m.15079 type:complete len:363 (+) Transcript_5220:301-1389(+)
MKFTTSIFLLRLVACDGLQSLWPWSQKLTSGRSLASPLVDRVDLGTLSVSPMGLGTLNLPLDKEEDAGTTEVLKTASTMGVNLFDTAEAYGFGKSETLTATSCRSAGLKLGTDDDDAVVATKFAPVPWRPDGSSVVEACKASAARLGLETVPLYQIHWPDVIQPFKAFGQENRKDELYWDGLAECYLSGLAENVGVSNYGSETLLRAHEALSKRGVPLVSNQINLSLLRYRSSEATVRTCEDLGVKVLAYFPLANGLLAGKYDEKPPSFPKSVTMKKYMDDTSPLLFILRRIAQERGKTVAQVSINWVMMKGAIPIPGARSATMARENFGSMGWALTDDEVLELEAAAANVMEFSSGGFELV